MSSSDHNSNSDRRPSERPNKRPRVDASAPTPGTTVDLTGHTIKKKEETPKVAWKTSFTAVKLAAAKTDIDLFFLTKILRYRTDFSYCLTGVILQCCILNCLVSHEQLKANETLECELRAVEVTALRLLAR